jgi:hypothetical protein
MESASDCPPDPTRTNHDASHPLPAHLRLHPIASPEPQELRFSVLMWIQTQSIRRLAVDSGRTIPGTNGR